MFTQVARWFIQETRNRKFDHPILSMERFLSTKPRCKIDARTLHVLDLHCSMDVYDYVHSVLTDNGCTDVSLIRSVDIVLGRNSDLHELIIGYWIPNLPYTLEYKTRMVSTPTDVSTMLELGYGITR